MSEETPERNALEEVVTKVQSGEGLTNEEAVVLLTAFSNCDLALDIQRTLVLILNQAMPDMARSLAASVLQRCGRADAKIKKSVEKLCASHIENLQWATLKIARDMYENTNNEGEQK